QALVTFKVERVLKGSPPVSHGQVRVEMIGGVSGSVSRPSFSLVYQEEEPLQFPGDRSVLFLQREKWTQYLRVQGYTGVYPFVGAKLIQPIGTRSFADSASLTRRRASSSRASSISSRGSQGARDQRRIRTVARE